MKFREIVLKLIQSDATLFSRVRAHACAVFVELRVKVLSNEKIEFNFPSRREHFLKLADFVELKVSDTDIESLFLKCAQDETDMRVRVSFLSVMLPFALIQGKLANTNPDNNIFVETPISCDLVFKCDGVLPLQTLQVDQSVCDHVKKHADQILTDILMQDAVGVPHSIQAGKQTSSRWEAVTFGDLMQLVCGKPPNVKAFWDEWSKSASRESLQLVALQLPNAFVAQNPETLHVADDEVIDVVLPKHATQHAALDKLSRFEPWAGPFVQSRVQNSLWKDRVSGEIVTHEKMMNLLSDDLRLIGGRADCVHLELRGGVSVSVQKKTSKVLQTMLGSSTSMPKTFCIVPQASALQPWSKGNSLQALKSESEAVQKAVLFQLVWTLSALQNTFEGFQHNALPENLQLFESGKKRCYKLQSIAFVIDKSVPLPVIVDFESATSTDGQLQKSTHFDPKKDLRDVLRELDMLHVDEESFSLQDMLVSELFDEFVSKQISGSIVCEMKI